MHSELRRVKFRSQLKPSQAHVFNSGELLDAQDAGQCLDCSRVLDVPLDCFSTCPYMLYKALRYAANNCEVGTDYNT